jgi:Arc/MetJ family transcription regulator
VNGLEIHNAAESEIHFDADSELTEEFTNWLKLYSQKSADLGAPASMLMNLPENESLNQSNLDTHSGPTMTTDGSTNAGTVSDQVMEQLADADKELQQEAIKSLSLHGKMVAVWNLVRANISSSERVADNGPKLEQRVTQRSVRKDDN